MKISVRQLKALIKEEVVASRRQRSLRENSSSEDLRKAIESIMASQGTETDDGKVALEPESFVTDIEALLAQFSKNTIPAREIGTESRKRISSLVNLLESYGINSHSLGFSNPNAMNKFARMLLTVGTGTTKKNSLREVDGAGRPEQRGRHGLSRGEGASARTSTT